MRPSSPTTGVATAITGSGVPMPRGLEMVIVPGAPQKAALMCGSAGGLVAGPGSGVVAIATVGWPVVIRVVPSGVYTVSETRRSGEMSCR